MCANVDECYVKATDGTTHESETSLARISSSSNERKVSNTFLHLMMCFSCIPRPSHGVLCIVSMYSFQASVHGQTRSVKAPTKTFINFTYFSLILHHVTAYCSDSRRKHAKICEHSSNSSNTGSIPSFLEEFGSLNSHRASSMLESEVRDMYVEGPGTL